MEVYTKTDFFKNKNPIKVEIDINQMRIVRNSLAIINVNGGRKRGGHGLFNRRLQLEKL